MQADRILPLWSQTRRCCACNPIPDGRSRCLDQRECLNSGGNEPASNNIGYISQDKCQLRAAWARWSSTPISAGFRRPLFSRRRGRMSYHRKEFGILEVSLDPSGKTPVYWHHRKVRNPRGTPAAGFFMTIRDRTAATHRGLALVETRSLSADQRAAVRTISAIDWILPCARERAGLRRRRVSAPQRPREG